MTIFSKINNELRLKTRARGALQYLYDMGEVMVGMMDLTEDPFTSTTLNFLEYCAYKTTNDSIKFNPNTNLSLGEIYPRANGPWERPWLTFHDENECDGQFEDFKAEAKYHINDAISEIPEENTEELLKNYFPNVTFNYSNVPENLECMDMETEVLTVTEPYIDLFHKLRKMYDNIIKAEDINVALTNVQNLMSYYTEIDPRGLVEDRVQPKAASAV